jgi:hypothetical protein
MAVANEILVTVRAGSRLFGTPREDSDFDYVRIFLPTIKETLLWHPVRSFNTKNEETREEIIGWPLQHFFKLLSQGQTQALEVMFATELAIMHPTVYWSLVRACFRKYPEKFLSKNTAAFVGYCRGQANKYCVKAERLEASNTLVAVLKEIAVHNKHIRTLAELGLIEIIRAWQPHKYLYIEDITFDNGTVMPHIVCCNVKCPSHFNLGQALGMYTNLQNQYGLRAKAALGAGTADWKALSHAVRVAREAKELLTDHTITLPLPYAPHIKAIKQGEVPYDQVIEEIDTLLVEVEEAQAKSTLPDNVDQEYINQLILEAYDYGLT